MPTMPSRPHLPARLSLRRNKSNTGHPDASPAPPTPPPQYQPQSRHESPSRSGNPVNNTAGNMSASSKTPTDARGDHRGMGLVLRVQVLKGRNLAAKDKSGTSDPFLVLTLGDAKEATSVVSKTLNPEWNQTFELPIISADSALLEGVCWDKDRFRNDYMGEFDVVLEDVFASGNTAPEPVWCRLESRRSGRKKKKDSNISGEVQLKFTLYDPINSAASAQHVMQKFTGIVFDSGEDDEDDEDDEDMLRRIGTRDLDDVDEEDDEKDPSDETDDGLRTPMGTPDEKQKHRRRRKLRRLRRRTKQKAYEFGVMSDVAGVLFLEINKITDLPPEKNMTKTTFDMDPFVVTSLGKKTYRTKTINHNLNPVFDEKLVFQVQKHETNYSLYFAVVDRDKFSGNDFVGTANFPLDKVRELAPEADSETGLYRLPDPDDVTEGKHRRRRFRNPLSRSTSQVNLSKNGGKRSSQTDLTKLSKSPSNSNIQASPRPALTPKQSETSFTDRTRPTPMSMTSTASYEEFETTADDDLNSFEIPLELKNKQRWEDKHSPILYVRAKYLPYKALRQQFWRVLLRQYDADENGRIDKIELVTMLDTLGSTLHDRTIDGFFERFQDVNGGEEILTTDQAVICLEEQLMKSQETQHHHMSNALAKLKRDDLATSTARLSSAANSPATQTPTSGSQTPSNFALGSANIPTLDVGELGDEGEQGRYLTTDETVGIDDDVEQDLTEGNESKEEHVVEIQECPICHQPRLARGRKTTDADIITHIATCASSDWRNVNNLVMAGFVSSSQAQRKWYSKVLTKVC